MNNWYKQLYIILLSIVTSSIHSARIVPGNAGGNESFTFSLGMDAHNATGSTLFVGARKKGTGGDYALSGLFSNIKGFIPHSPAITTLNGQADQANPLYDAAIIQLGLFGVRSLVGHQIMNPIAVTQEYPANIYYVDSCVQTSRQEKSGCDGDETLVNVVGVCTNTISVENVKDATGVEVTTEIIGLQRFEQEAIFAAVKPHDIMDDDFGQPGSGIAVIKLVHTKVDECVQSQLIQINAQPGDSSDLPRASALDVTSDAIKIGNDVVSIENIIDMHYSDRLKRLYIALQVQGGADATDGACGVVVGRLVNGKLIFAPIAPDNVFTNQDKIVGGTGADTQVSIHKVRTMSTTTGLDYAIVVGQTGAPDDTRQSVFAMPLVNTILTGTLEQETQGTLANVLIDPEEFFSKNEDKKCNTLAQAFLGRSFVQAATEPDQVFTDMSVQAVVGIDDLPNGDITDINVSNDVVFVSVANTVDNEKPGIFCSRALFDDAGVIGAWTPWERVAGTTDKVFGFSYQAIPGGFIWLTGQTDQSIKTVKQTEWGKGAQDGLADLGLVIEEQLPQGCGGVQGFFDLPQNSPGLFDISLFIATGLNKLLLIESAQQDANGVLCPNSGNFHDDLRTFTAGEITTNFPNGDTKVISISGGVLDDIGPIIAATIGVDDITDQGYLFVGGAYGLAVLAQEDGNGWSTMNALGKNFSGLVAGMRFISLDDYCFVRKLIFDGGFLYVLTDTQLDRIDIAASDFATGVLSVVTVATLSDILRGIDGTMLDVAVSDRFALLAGSTGIFRVGDDANIQTATDSSEVDWTSVIIPEGLPVVRQLQTIASNGLPNGFAKTDNGNVYALDAYRGFDFAQENRYTVQSVVNQPIDNDTVVPLPDMNIKDILTSFARFGVFKNLINVDGTDNFSARNRVQTLSPLVRNRLFVLPLGIEDASTVSAIVRSSASGAWLITGDFGLRVNE
ncbi:MAG: hypothetical protein WD055_00440 [Candidatus Dependentiae bacterium]